MRWFGRALGALALSLVLGSLLALIISNYSLTPSNAKLGLLVTTAIVAGTLFTYSWRLLREILRHRRRP